MEMIRGLEHIAAYNSYQLSEDDVDALYESIKKLREVERWEQSRNITDISK